MGQTNLPLIELRSCRPEVSADLHSLFLINIHGCAYMWERRREIYCNCIRSILLSTETHDTLSSRIWFYLGVIIQSFLLWLIHLKWCNIQWKQSNSLFLSFFRFFSFFVHNFHHIFFALENALHWNCNGKRDGKHAEKSNKQNLGRRKPANGDVLNSKL